MIIIVFIFVTLSTLFNRGRRGRDRIVVGITTTYEISTNYHNSCEFESRSSRGILDATFYVIKFVNDLR